jgi:ABC-2 type transport system permease protein
MRKMRSFFTVFSFEFFSVVKTRVFIAATSIVAVIIVAFGFFPVYARNLIIPFDNEPKELKKAIAFTNFSQDSILEKFPEYEWTFSRSEQEFKDALDGGNFSVGLELRSAGRSGETAEAGSYTIYNADQDLTGLFNEGVLSDMLKRDYQKEFASAFGIFRDSEDEKRFFEPEIKGEVVSLGKNILESYWSGYFLLLFLYMLIMIYNQQIMNSVAREKSTKTIEILISSTDTRSLIFGKVVGSVCAALFQASALLTTAFISIALSRSAWENFSPMVLTVMDMSLNFRMIVYSLVFMALGFFVYSFLFAGFASTISRMEETHQISIIPSLIVVTAFFIAITGAMSPNSELVKICSYVPFLSPFVMYARICVAEAPPLGVAAAILINLATILFSGFIGARIYRSGVLNYGKASPIKEILRSGN